MNFIPDWQSKIVKSSLQINLSENWCYCAITVSLKDIFSSESKSRKKKEMNEWFAPEWLHQDLQILILTGPFYLLAKVIL